MNDGTRQEYGSTKKLQKRTQDCLEAMLSILSKQGKVSSAELADAMRDMGYGSQAVSTARKILKETGRLFYAGRRFVISKEYGIENGYDIKVLSIRKTIENDYAGIVKPSVYGEKGCFVYFIKRNNDGIFKIGISGDLAERLNAIAYNCGSHVTLIASLDLENREMAEEIEAILHNRFDAQRIIGEWFNLTKSQVFFVAQYLEKAFNGTKRGGANV